jgi:hypothetical protein
MNMVKDTAEGEIDDAVPDGGGCTEAWEAMNNVREENSTRRSMLRHLLGGALTLSAVGSGHAVANDERRSEIRSVEGRERNQLLEHFVATSEYRRLADRIRSDGYSIQLRSAATVFGVEQENRTIELAYRQLNRGTSMRHILQLVTK